MATAARRGPGPGRLVSMAARREEQKEAECVVWQGGHPRQISRACCTVDSLLGRGREAETLQKASQQEHLAETTPARSRPSLPILCL